MEEKGVPITLFCLSDRQTKPAKVRSLLKLGVAFVSEAKIWRWSRGRALKVHSLVSTQSGRVSFPPMVAKKSKLPPDIYCFPCLFVFSLRPLNTRSFSYHFLTSVLSQRQESQCFPFLMFLSVSDFWFHYYYFFGRPYLLLNLPSFFQNPGLLPVHHTRLFHQASSDVYIIEASRRRPHGDGESKSLASCVAPAVCPALPEHARSFSAVYGVVSSCLLTCIL